MVYFVPHGFSHEEKPGSGVVDDVMDRVGLPLLGLVPEDASVVLAAANGMLLIDYGRQGASQACRNLAARLQGRRVPLMKLK